ncbi:MAG: transposase [Chromatiales bacterium]|nr:transposase [Chromatiales bacterium]
MFNGLIDLPWWGYILALLGLTHITIASVTIFLHRAQAHRALDLHPVVSHFFRFWLWLTTGMVTKEWVAIHRKHHAKVETPDDPHSPQVLGIGKVMREGAELYRAAAADQSIMEKYGKGTPDDWLERHVYSQHNVLGVSLLLITYVALFGAIGLSMWAIHMIWIPFWAAGVINGLGHYLGYRNFEPRDGSTNLTPVGILIGGEELHNNHHAFPSSAKFSMKRWEFDIGWMYIRLMQAVGLAKVKKVAPQPVHDAEKAHIDLETVRAIVVARLHVLSHYARHVIVPVLREELARADASYHRALKKTRRLLVRDESRITPKAQQHIEQTLEKTSTLRVVYEYRQRLQDVWNRSYSSQEKLTQALQEWCQQAEATGVRALQDFVRHLRGFSLAPAPVAA